MESLTHAFCIVPNGSPMERSNNLKQGTIDFIIDQSYLKPRTAEERAIFLREELELVFGRYVNVFVTAVREHSYSDNGKGSGIFNGKHGDSVIVYLN